MAGSQLKATLSSYLFCVVKVKSLLLKFHRYRTRKYSNTALFGGGCWVSLARQFFHRHSAAGWAECTVAGPGRVRRHAAQFSERSSPSLIGHARVALSGVLIRLPSTQTDDTQRGGKGHNCCLPHRILATRRASKGNRWEEKKVKAHASLCSKVIWLKPRGFKKPASRQPMGSQRERGLSAVWLSSDSAKIQPRAAGPL